jgi:5,10-methylene-tetrahydrofolate dehydrogenase/methenyl tetrahydrofolate cyclohydrolase
MSEATGKGLLLKADPIAATFRDEVITSLAERTRSPKLVGILATSSAPSKSYAEFTKRQCEDLGVEFVLRRIGAAASSDLSEGEGVEEAIIEANEDDSVQGIMVCIVVPLQRDLTDAKHMTLCSRCITRFLVLSRFDYSSMSEIMALTRYIP